MLVEFERRAGAVFVFNDVKKYLVVVPVFRSDLLAQLTQLFSQSASSEFGGDAEV